MPTISFTLNPHLYLRDPQRTELGQKIIKSSVELIDQLGFEQFTFKKLAEEINSTEASIYRYFENKHRLLLYLIGWYWNWLEYRIDLFTSNLSDPKDKIVASIKVLAEEKKMTRVLNLSMKWHFIELLLPSLVKPIYQSKLITTTKRDYLVASNRYVKRYLSGLLRLTRVTNSPIHW